MKISSQDKIKRLVEEAKDFPNAVIEYSFELPKMKGVKKDSFMGVKAKYNSNVNPNTGAMISYKLS